MKSASTVYIVGAGPGDPGLLTVRANELLEQADILVVDALVNPVLYQHNDRVHVIFVGKRGPGAKQGASHILPQKKINQLIIRLAKSGKRIVRLKGGDPFVFGRGGEEMEALAKAKIPYEIVPGVSSVVAVPAYAGIPITDRRLASQVTIITGHEQPNKSAQAPLIDWDHLSTHGTLVVLMGVTQWPQIQQRLIDRGWAKQTPVAAIESGTTSDQRTLKATLLTSADVFKKQQLVAPAVIVVGAVAARAQIQSWVKKQKPLLDRTVVVTRARGQNDSLSRLLKNAGANVIECPAIKIEPLPFKYSAQLFDSINQRIDWIIFYSANAVRYFKDAGLVPPKRARVCAVGPATATAVREHGWRVDKLPRNFNARGVLSALGNIKNKNIFVPRVQNGPREAIESLEKNGAHVIEAALYQTLPAPAPSPFIKKLILDQADAITFTSASTVQNFLSFFNMQELRALFKKTQAISIGPSTTKALKDNGVQYVTQARESTLESLLKTIR